MRPDKRLATRVVEVTLHEKIQQVSRVAANGAQLGVAALQDLIAESCTHICTSFKKCAWELE